MIEQQFHEKIDHHDVNDGNKMKLESAIVFSNVVLCSACGMQMNFVENDVIFGEDWYHGKCWQKTQEEKQHD